MSEKKDAMRSLMDLLSEQMPEELLVESTIKDLRELQVQLAIGNEGEELKKVRKKVLAGATLLMRRLAIEDMGKEAFEQQSDEMRKAHDLIKKDPLAGN